MINRRRYNISITTHTIVKVILTAVIALLVFRFIKSVSHYLILIAIGAFLALSLNPLVNWMHSTIGGKRGLAVALTYLTLFLSIGGFLSAITPTLANQTVSFISNVPVTLQALKTEDTTVARFARKIKLTDEIDNFTQDFASHTKDITKFALDVAGRITSALVSIIAVLVLAFMFLVEAPRWGDRFWRLQTSDRRKRFKPLFEQMYDVFTGYVNGQLLVSLIGAAISLALFVIVGVPNAGVLAGLIFLTGLIPLVGHPIGAAAVTILTLFASLDKALIVGIFFIIYMQVQAATIQPYVQAKSNDMTPLTVFIAALVGIAVGGFLGAFVAIPLAGCARILFLDYMKRREA